VVAHVAVRSLSKRYEGVQALDNVTLSFERGRIHGLVGENGAGKSTLGKIIAGAVLSDSGEILIDGKPVHYRGPRDALAVGVALVHQEIVLAPCLSVVDNVYLGAESRLRLRKRERRAQLQALIRETGFGPPDVDASIATLRLAEQQQVEILRAVARRAELIVMDEPSAALTTIEADRLHGVMRMLRERGTTIIFVSHNLDEVLKLADTISVLKDGRLVRTTPARQETKGSLISAMLGRSLDATFPAKTPPEASTPMALRVSGLCRKEAVEDVSLSIRRGEIVGLAGLVGSGRSEVARAIFGADRPDAGVIEVAGRAVSIRSPRHAIREGIVLIPESRKESGLLMERPIRENLTLPHLRDFTHSGVLRRRLERQAAAAVISRVGIRAPSGEIPVAQLSGGNQQKVMFGKWLRRPPAVLIADEPTRGVDVGAKRAIYDLIRELALEGMGVLLISSELEEIMGLAHRILVMHRRRIVAELGGDASEDEILAAAFAGSNTIARVA
jgi:simple sugar transport system ATP-binding protein/ribose transport system ATP-binding protein